MNAVRVVLVEDNLGDAVLMKEIIDGMGLDCDLRWFHDGEDALDYFAGEGTADFILLDLNLPRMTGHEVMRTLQGRGVLERSSLVVMTGSTLPRDQEQFREVPGARYLIKPMGLEEMEELSAELKRIFLGQQPPV